MARSLDLAVTPWSVLGAGVLTGKYSRGAPPEEGRAKESVSKIERNLEIADAVIEMADEIGCTPSQVAISWVRQQRGAIVPLIGARNEEQLKDNLGALDVVLTDEQQATLEEVSRIRFGFPHDFLTAEYVEDLIYGGTRDQIDHHRPRSSGLYREQFK